MWKPHRVIFILQIVWEKICRQWRLEKLRSKRISPDSSQLIWYSANLRRSQICLLWTSILSLCAFHMYAGLTNYTFNLLPDWKATTYCVSIGTFLLSPNWIMLLSLELLHIQAFHQSETWMSITKSDRNLILHVISRRISTLTLFILVGYLSVNPDILHCSTGKNDPIISRCYQCICMTATFLDINQPLVCFICILQLADGYSEQSPKHIM